MVSLKSLQLTNLVVQFLVGETPTIFYIKEVDMKSFKRYVKENLVGTSNERGIDADTGMSAGDVTNADTLRKLNAFIGTLGNMEYLLPEHALNRLRTQFNESWIIFR